MTTSHRQGVGAAALDRVMSWVLTGATVVAAGVLVTNRFAPPTPAMTKARLEFITNWESEIAGSATYLGDSAGQVRVAVFTDFQCPFCRHLDSALSKMEAEHQGKLVRAVLNFPLAGHEQAKPAAIAFECAGAQGRAAEMDDALFAGQAALGIVPWSEYATRAGVPDLGRFNDCLAGASEANRRVEAGLALGSRLGVSGTPAAIVNGWLIDPALPSSVETAMRAVLSGKSPER